MLKQSHQLKKQGYCIFKNSLSINELNSFKNFSLKAIKNLSSVHREKNKSQGSLILISDYPIFSTLIGHPVIRKIFEKLEFTDPRFSSGYIISKPSKSPALFWHQDWWGWDHPLSYTKEIAQVFVMIYLQKTYVENGCLRVIPGSHRTPHFFHESNKAHSDALSKVENPNDSHFESIPEEVSVSVNSGDVIIGDARLIHGSFPNQTNTERTLITLWFHPHFRKLPETIQSRICEIFNRNDVDTDDSNTTSLTPINWPESARKLIQDLFPKCASGLKPHPWNRTPQWFEN